MSSPKIEKEERARCRCRIDRHTSSYNEKVNTARQEAPPCDSRGLISGLPRRTAPTGLCPRKDPRWAVVPGEEEEEEEEQAEKGPDGTGPGEYDVRRARTSNGREGTSGRKKLEGGDGIGKER